MRHKAILAALLVALGLVTLTGCTRVDLHEQDGFIEETVRLKGAEAAEVDLRMGPGNLTIAGGGAGLMKGEFRYSSSSMQPEIDYQVDNGVGELDIRQGNSMSGPFDWLGMWDGGFRNEWALAFGDEVPIDMRLQLGAGDTRLDVGDIMLTDLNIDTGAGNLEVDAVGSDTLDEFSLNSGAGDMRVLLASGRVLRNVDIDVGAGNVRVDLSGENWEEDMDVKIDTGAGDLTVILPAEISARVHVEKGIGETKAGDLRTEDGDYVNDAFGGAGPRIEIDINHGVGNVILRLE